jgi:predicted DNA-binding protein
MAKTLQKIVSAQLPATEAQRLEQLAREADRTVSAELRRAVRAHLERSTSMRIQ